MIWVSLSRVRDFLALPVSSRAIFALNYFVAKQFQNLHHQIFHKIFFIFYIYNIIVLFLVFLCQCITFSQSDSVPQIMYRIRP